MQIVQTPKTKKNLSQKVVKQVRKVRVQEEEVDHIWDKQAGRLRLMKIIIMSD